MIRHLLRKLFLEGWTRRFPYRLMDEGCPGCGSNDMMYHREVTDTAPPPHGDLWKCHCMACGYEADMESTSAYEKNPDMPSGG